jgi:hypothetical protein
MLPTTLEQKLGKGVKIPPGPVSQVDLDLQFCDVQEESHAGDRAQSMGFDVELGVYRVFEDIAVKS